MSSEATPIDNSQHPARSSADTHGQNLQVVVFGPQNSGKTAIASLILLALQANGVSASHNNAAFTPLDPAQRQNDLQVKKPLVALFEMADNQQLHTLVDEFEQSARAIAGIGDEGSREALRREVGRMHAVLAEIESWKAMQ